MPDKKLFEVVNKNINKFEIRLQNYIIPSLQTSKLNKNGEENLIQKTLDEDHIKNELLKAQTSAKGQQVSKPDGKTQSPVKKVEETLEEKAIREKNEILERYAVFAEKQVTEQPKLCMWLYMSEENVKCLLNLTSKQKIRESIDNNMKLEYPKGISRLLVIELMYSVVRFCQKCKFTVIQTGTLLSIFYLTHECFLSAFNNSVEKMYSFFKEYMLLHCFECPPDSMELFNYRESIHIVRYFCTLYLQNLPLIRLLTLPNFGFNLNYEKKPDPFEEMGKKGKGKGKDKGKAGKGGKKGKK